MPDLNYYTIREGVEVEPERIVEHIAATLVQPDGTPIPTGAGITISQTPTVTAGAYSAGDAVGVAYSVGDVVTYQGREYQCRQAHTSISTWTPPLVQSLWQALPESY